MENYIRLPFLPMNHRNLNLGLEKYGPLYPHQELCRRFLAALPLRTCALFIQAPGRGKTMAMLGSTVTDICHVITKANITPEFKHNLGLLGSHGGSDLREYIYSTYNKFFDMYSKCSNEKLSKDFDGTTIIIDEVHSILGDNNIGHNMIELMSRIYDLADIYLYCASSTPMINNVSEFEGLLRISGCADLDQFIEKWHIFYKGPVQGVRESIKKMEVKMRKSQTVEYNDRFTRAGFYKDARYTAICRAGLREFLIDYENPHNQERAPHSLWPSWELWCTFDFDHFINAVAEYSILFAEWLRIEYDRLIYEESLITTVYTGDIIQEGSDLYMLCLAAMDWRRADTNNIEDSTTPKYGLFTSDSTGDTAIRKSLMSSNNVSGKYVRIVLFSKAYSTGVSFNNVGIVEGIEEWNTSTQVQAKGRSIRDSSHRTFIEKCRTDERFRRRNSRYIDKNNNVIVRIYEIFPCPDINYVTKDDDRYGKVADTKYSIGLFMYETQRVKDMEISEVMERLKNSSINEITDKVTEYDHSAMNIYDYVTDQRRNLLAGTVSGCFQQSAVLRELVPDSLYKYSMLPREITFLLYKNGNANITDRNGLSDDLSVYNIPVNEDAVRNLDIALELLLLHVHESKNISDLDDKILIPLGMYYHHWFFGEIGTQKDRGHKIAIDKFGDMLDLNESKENGQTNSWNKCRGRYVTDKGIISASYRILNKTDIRSINALYRGSVVIVTHLANVKYISNVSIRKSPGNTGKRLPGIDISLRVSSSFRRYCPEAAKTIDKGNVFYYVMSDMTRDRAVRLIQYKLDNPCIIKQL